jgi:beta-glucosidase
MSSLVVRVGTTCVLLSLSSAAVFAQFAPIPAAKKPDGPWMNTSLSPDERAELIVKELTLDEKISLVHGGPHDMAAMFDPNAEPDAKSLGNAGYVPGIPRLGIVDIRMADATVGVTHSAAFGRYSTPLPSTMAEASSWNIEIAREYGSLIGRELRDQGYTMTLGGGVNLAREPRNGRNFEYHGEDPLLAGEMVGTEMKAEQAQRIIGDLKHFALNESETGRNVVNVKMSKRAMQETSLLAFGIALKESNAGAVMCSYNEVEGDYSCENKYLLDDVLRKEFGFKGFVVSDWGGTHSTVKAVNAGLDVEMPDDHYFGKALRDAIESGQIPMAKLDAMVERIVRTEIAVGVFDHPSDRQVPDVFKGIEVAKKVAEESIVLLKNSNGQLPLSPRLHSIAIIGSHADVAVLSGGGSGQVDPIGGNAVDTEDTNPFTVHVWHRSSPMKAIAAKAPNATVKFDEGKDVNAAAALARSSDLAIVFVHQFVSEALDVPSLSLPENQDALVSAVAAANPKTIVVVESGGPVSMPWVDHVNAVIEAWFPGIKGGEAIADILFGDVNPSAKLPVSFAKSDADLEFPQLPAQPAARGPQDEAQFGPGMKMNTRHFDLVHDDGLLVGYRYFEAKKIQPLFPFGYGLSYTTYAYSSLNASPQQVTFQVKNTGQRAGAEVAEVYAILPQAAGEPFKRLIGFAKVALEAGESKTVTIPLDAKLFSIFDESKDGWELVPGDYTVLAGGSSEDLPLHATIAMHE